MTPQQRADSVKQKHGVRYEQLMHEAMRLLNLPRNLDWRGNRMLEITKEITAMIAPVSPCKKGCAHCCYQAVIISSWEANRIAKVTKRKIADFQGYVPRTGARDKLVERFTNVCCPFLEANECGIYDVRPFVCRTHFSLDDDNSACNILIKPGAVVPYMNLKDLEQMIAFLLVENDCKFGDIREFFK